MFLTHMKCSVTIETSWFLTAVSLEWDDVAYLSSSHFSYTAFSSYSVWKTKLSPIFHPCWSNFTSFILPLIWHCGCGLGGEEEGEKILFLQRWRDVSRIRGDRVSVKVRQLVWEMDVKERNEFEKGGGGGDDAGQEEFKLLTTSETLKCDFYIETDSDTFRLIPLHIVKKWEKNTKRRIKRKKKMFWLEDLI